VAVGFGAVWVSAPAGLWRIEPGRTSTRLAPLRGGYRAVAATGGAAWAAGSLEPVLVRIDPDTRREVARIRLPRPGREVAGGASGVWIAFGGPPDEGPGTVARLDPVTERLGPEIELPGWASGIAVDDDGAWVAVWDRAVVVRVPADGGAAEPPINVRRHPVGIALIGGAVLVASDAGVVTRIDPATGRIEGLPTIVGGRPYAVAAGDAGLWVSSQEGRTLRRVPVG
jgi:streptogramin lyase